MGSVIWAVVSTSAIRSVGELSAREFARTIGVTIADTLRLEKQGTLRAHSESADAVLDSLTDQVATGEISNEAAVSWALRFFALQQIGRSGYFFVVDSDGNVIYHPDPSVAAENQAETPIVQRVIRQKSGFVRYYWQNSGDRQPRDKYGYISYFAPWDWYIVASDYAAGFLERLPRTSLASLLNGYHQDSLIAAFVRDGDLDVIGASDGWQNVAGHVMSSESWIRGHRWLTSGVEPVSRDLIVAYAPLPGFDAEVGAVFSIVTLRAMTRRFGYLMLGVIVLGLLAIAVASRAASRYVTRPVRQLSHRLHKRLGPEYANVSTDGRSDLRTIVLQQLRALVRLDYERRGRVAAEHEAMLAQQVFRHTTEGIVIADGGGFIVRANPAFLKTTGYQEEELIGKSTSILKSKRNSPDFFRVLADSLESTGEWVGELWNRRKDGSDFPQLLSVRALGRRNGRVESYIAVCHDISERKEAELRLHHLATHDSLTGLPNRAYLSDALGHIAGRSRRNGKQMAVLFLDLDNFKDVNDSYGHETGDQLLTWIARTLERQLRDEDIVVRFGGDEFVILLPEVQDSEYASVVARRILASVREPYPLGPQKMRPSVSIGITIYPEAKRNESDILRDADAAMYAAKRGGRNTYRFHNPAMNETAHRRVAMQGSVAVGLDLGEFVVLYQPILSLADDRVASAEALVRWNRDGKLISPEEFLPFLENSSMQIRLDLWVLDQVCLDLNSLAGEPDDDFLISVNAGSYNLIQDDFVHRVTEIVSRNGVDPGRIAIEVTETAAIRSFDRARATLRELQAAGFKLYLDDFGEGYSSIRYLREFGVDTVKLDRAYVADVEKLESARSLVSGFTQLAHGMRLEAIIEGVETRGQLEFIRSAGCDYAQGYLISVPTDLQSAISARLPSESANQT